MNFFAHYHYHHKDGDHWHNAGLLFPDLLRIFTAKQRVTPQINLKDSSLPFYALQKGIKMHFSADDRFHNWEPFLQLSHVIALKIRDSNLAFERDWFLAHIFFELALDHILVTDNEQQVGDLYQSLQLCDKELWYQFFSLCKLSQTDKWIQGLDRFTEHRFIFTYKDTEKVVYALNRIYQRSGIGIFNSNQIDFLIVLLNEFIPVIRKETNDLQKLMA